MERVPTLAGGEGSYLPWPVGQGLSTLARGYQPWSKVGALLTQGRYPCCPSHPPPPPRQSSTTNTCWRGGRYASCVHVVGLSSFQFLPRLEFQLFPMSSSGFYNLRSHWTSLAFLLYGKRVVKHVDGMAIFSYSASNGKFHIEMLNVEPNEASIIFRSTAFVENFKTITFLHVHVFVRELSKKSSKTIALT